MTSTTDVTPAGAGGGTSHPAHERSLQPGPGPGGDDRAVTQPGASDDALEGPGTARPRRFGLWLGLIALGGLAVRLIYVFAWKNPGWEVGDAVYYHEGANLLADGEGYIHPYHWIRNGLRMPGADHPPGYLTTLAAFSLLGFRTFLEHQVVSCLLGTLGVLTVGLAGRRIAGERVGLLAALLVAVNPNVWFHDSAVMSETLVVATTALVLLTAYRWWDRPSPASACWFGLTVGVAALARSEALLLGVVIAVPLVVWQALAARRAADRAPAGDAAGDDPVDGGTSAGGDTTALGPGGPRRTGWWGAVRQLVVAGGMAAVVIAPWVAYNVSRFEHPVTLSSQFEQTLVAANCQEVYYGPNTGFWWPQCMMAVDPLMDPLDDASEEGIVFRRVAREYVANHTKRAPVVVAARVGRTFGAYQPENQLELDRAVDGKEKGLGQAGLFAWYGIAIAGAAGLVGLRRAGRPIFPIVAVVAATAVTVMATYGTTRFRLPAELALTIPAAVSLDAALPAARRRWQQWRTATPPSPRAAGGTLTDRPAIDGAAAEAGGGDQDSAHPMGVGGPGSVGAVVTGARPPAGLGGGPAGQGTSDTAPAAGQGHGGDPSRPGDELSASGAEADRTSDAEPIAGGAGTTGTSDATPATGPDGGGPATSPQGSDGEELVADGTGANQTSDADLVGSGDGEAATAAGTESGGLASSPRGSGAEADQRGVGDELVGGDPGADVEKAAEGSSPDVPGGLGSSGGRFAGFDGLRAIAALGVLLTHVSLASGLLARTSTDRYLARADVGVALFFALSGFLLYRPFVSARLDGRPGPAVRRYLRHRLLRILPAYWLALTVLAVVLDIRRLDEIRTPWDFIRYYGLLQSYSEGTALGGLQQAWTLTNELAFYLVLPLWAAGAAWLARRFAARAALQVELLALLAAMGGALGFRWWLQTFQVNDPTTGSFDPRFHWILANFNMFVPGMALALGYEWSRRRERPLRLLELLRRHPVACWLLAGVCFWAVSTQVDLTYLGTPGPVPAVAKELLYAAVGLLMLAPVALAGGELPRSLRWLGTRVMVTLGVLSYGIYLWHEGVIDIYRDIRDYESPDGSYLLSGSFPVMLAVVLLGTLAVAALSYVLVERPALRLKDRDVKLFATWRPVGLPAGARLRLLSTAGPQSLSPAPTAPPEPATTNPSA